ANSMNYKLTEDLFKIYSTNLKDILSMISIFKESITDFETTKGTLNDVFLTVTGKEIK
ncbi:MAG: nodI2, partial [Clostridium sp.]|nr:nodI2 [Clostridium sp.]